jgi:hypothetical protein
VHAGNKFLGRSVHKTGRLPGHQGQGSFTRIGEHFDFLRLDYRGKVHTLPKARSAFLLVVKEAGPRPKRGEARPSYFTTQVVNPFPRRTSSSAGFVCRSSRSQERDRRPTTIV